MEYDGKYYSCSIILENLVNKYNYNYIFQESLKIYNNKLYLSDKLQNILYNLDDIEIITIFSTDKQIFKTGDVIKSNISIDCDLHSCTNMIFLNDKKLYSKIKLLF